MTTKLQLVNPTMPVVPAGTPRAVLIIVKALALDNVKLPNGSKGSKCSTKGRSITPAASNDEQLPESGRNNTLTSMAGSMRRRGMSAEAINAGLQAENIAHCDPPLEANEVSAIAASIMRYPSGDPVDIYKSLNETGNAVRFGTRHKSDVLYVPGMSWFLWDGLRWNRDQLRKVMELAKQVARDIYFEGDTVQDDNLRVAIAKQAKASLKASSLKAMLELAQSLPELVIPAERLDTHDMLLGVANGVVNLRTGKLQPVQCDQLMTRHSPVSFDAEATCPQFMAFLHRVTAGNQSIALYLRRVFGYALSGMTTEQCLFFLYGGGANGKSTILNILKELLGSDFASQTPSETLMTKHSSATNDIARLQSVRAVIANEIEDGSLMAESLVKQMTGGEALTARFHYQEFFQFTPKFKLFIAGNHKPVIRGRDNGIWRRIRLIPFEVIIPKTQQDPHLQSKLRTELPGILNWAIEGCKDWLRQGLAEPKIITDSVNAYREEMDIIGAWQKESCTVGLGLEIKASTAYFSYKVWSEANGYKPMSNGTFGRDLAGRFKRVQRKDGNYYLGFA